MTPVQFICHNGEYYHTDKLTIGYKNRAFKYGDGLFETIKAINTEPLFFNDHFERLKKGMKILELKAPDYFISGYLKEKIIRLLNANKLFKSARVRLTVYRKQGGAYLPENNEAEFLIEAASMESEKYNLNTKGLVVDIFPTILKPISVLSNLKTINSLPFVMAGLYKQKNKLDDCIILNENKHISESVSSNIFLVKNQQLYTPSLSEGCIDGVMRKQIIKLAAQMKLKVYENGFLIPEDLMLADEFFLTNTIVGIQWVIACREKRFFNKTSIEIINKLNEFILKH